MNGFINLLKPPGMSSGTAVAIIKRLTGERVGHAGTLDPEASGVLPILVGYFTDKGKSYVAEIAFAGATDTQDAQGVIVEEGERIPDRDEILAALPAFTGVIMQRPPSYSAVKRGGVPLYALARKGEMVITEARKTDIFSLELGEKTGKDGYMLHIDCGGGTYIRTLCHDLGQAMKAPAHMRFLLRTRAGAFHIENAVTLEEIRQAAEENRLEEMLLPLETPLMTLPELHVPEKLEKLARNGGKLPARLMPDLENEARCRIYFQDTLLGVGRRDGEEIRFDVGLTGGKE